MTDADVDGAHIADADVLPPHHAAIDHGGACIPPAFCRVLRDKESDYIRNEPALEKANPLRA